jgi:hypothetical protein
MLLKFFLFNISKLYYKKKRRIFTYISYYVFNNKKLLFAVILIKKFEICSKYSLHNENSYLGNKLQNIAKIL